MAVLKKTKVGKVVRNKMDKTVVVEISRRLLHPDFRKYYNKVNKLKVHDEANACQIGDKVMIKESKPISKDKRWVVTKVLEKAAL